VAPLKKALQAAEQAVTKLSESIARIDKALADPDLYARHPHKAQRLSLERGQRAKELEAAEEAWLAAGESYETASSAAGANPD
jgi:ATP-binding cassette subfamily F protein 3